MKSKQSSPQNETAFLKQKVKKLNTALKLLTGLSFGLLGASIVSGITAFGFMLKDNLEFEKERVAKNLTYNQQVYSPSTKVSKAVFLATTYSMFAGIGATLITNEVKERSEKDEDVYIE